MPDRSPYSIPEDASAAACAAYFHHPGSGQVCYEAIDAALEAAAPALHRQWAEELLADDDALDRLTRAYISRLVPCRSGRHPECHGEGDHPRCRAEYVLRAALGLDGGTDGD